MNYMQMAIELAQKGKGLTSPNPMVGCVIERANKIVGSGWHKGPGHPHAEIEALNQAGALAKGANLYVNLEPCCHHGKTPPCVDAIIAAQVKSVHAAVLDPNLLVNGQGIKKLQQARIEVFLGEETEPANNLNECFFHFITKNRPFVIAKWAMSLDGKIMTATNNSKWITGADAREHAHELRQQVDAILVGANTVLHDNPKLTAKKKQPLRIILDGSGKTSADSFVYQTNSACKTLVATTAKSSKQWRQQLESQGVMVQTFKQRNIDLEQLLQILGKQNITSLIVEGGAAVLTSFFRAKLVNKTYTYIAPKIIGGTGTPILDLGISKVANALQLYTYEVKTIGDDQLIINYPKWS